MNNAQKVIKYVAIAVAISLVVAIVGSILTGILAISGISAVIDVANNNVETMSYTKEYENVNSIEIDVSAIDLEILPANKLNVSGTEIPVDYKFEEENGTLKIKGKKVKTEAKLIICVPNNMVELDLDIGAGKIEIEDITVQKFNLDTGAADTKIENLIVTSKAEIDAGVGEITIKNSDLSNLDLDAGVGNIEYNGYLRGMCTVNCGVGSVDINLIGGEAMYNIIAERGIGELRINDAKLSGTQTIGNGSNIIKLSGGVGSLKITY